MVKWWVALIIGAFSLGLGYFIGTLKASVLYEQAMIVLNYAEEQIEKTGKQIEKSQEEMMKLREEFIEQQREGRKRGT
jgi:hypothetical protein